mgnify:CR=1 FL=1
MRIQDLKSMKFEELWDLHAELTKMLVEKIGAEKSELEKRLAILNRASVPGAADAAEPEAQPETARTKVPAKYRNTEPPHETWSGRGKLPRWLRKALEAGAKIDDFKIG